MSQYKTPLRYPGGKQKLWQFVREVLESNDLLASDYVEPFAGGAGVAMELLLSGVVSKVHLNDASRPVYAFWSSVKKTPDQLCRRIRSASITVEEWKKQREVIRDQENHSLEEVGFALFFLNRCNRSGIIGGGLIGGLDQSGPWKMDARFNRKGLICRVEAIAERASQIHIRNWDAARFIREYINRLSRKSLVYLDPPYFKKADRLYLNHYDSSSHSDLAKIIQNEISQPWLVSYDNVPEIAALYRKRTTFSYQLQYNAAKAYKGSELFIFADGMFIPAESGIHAINDAIQCLS